MIDQYETEYDEYMKSNGSESENTSEEIIYSADQEQSNEEASTNTDSNSEINTADYEEMIGLLDTIHDDLLKIMISIWVLTGLVLGTKLIKGLFGYG